MQGSGLGLWDSAAVIHLVYWAVGESGEMPLRVCLFCGAEMCQLLLLCLLLLVHTYCAICPVLLCRMMLVCTVCYDFLLVRIWRVQMRSMLLTIAGPSRFL
jgi:hypothetical protein